MRWYLATLGLWLLFSMLRISLIDIHLWFFAVGVNIYVNMLVYSLGVIFLLQFTPPVLGNKVIIHSVPTPRTIGHPLALKELQTEIQNRSLPWNSFLPDESEQQSRVFSEGKFRSAGFGSGAYVVGPPKRLIFGNNDTYRNTPLTPLRENYMNCSSRKLNPAAYDEALYPCK